MFKLWCEWGISLISQIITGHSDAKSMDFFRHSIGSYSQLYVQIKSNDCSIRYKFWNVLWLPLVNARSYTFFYVGVCSWITCEPGPLAWNSHWGLSQDCTKNQEWLQVHLCLLWSILVILLYGGVLRQMRILHITSICLLW